MFRLVLGVQTDRSILGFNLRGTGNNLAFKSNIFIALIMNIQTLIYTKHINYIRNDLTFIYNNKRIRRTGVWYGMQNISLWENN